MFNPITQTKHLKGSYNQRPDPKDHQNPPFHRGFSQAVTFQKNNQLLTAGGALDHEIVNSFKALTDLITK